MRNMFLVLVAIILIIFAASCLSKDKRITGVDTSNYKLLELIPTTQSNLSFNNKITETPQINTVSFDGMLQGAGVAILDINKDNLPDIYFAGNQVRDKIFLNKGNFKFEDVTQKAGIHHDGSWTTGVAAVDINGDGFDDLYVCKFLFDEPNKRKNKFYINNQDGTFTDKATEWGIADNGYSIMANFFDLDNDGYLDLYLANQPPNSLQGKATIKGKIDLNYTDRLFRNIGDKFVEITPAGMGENFAYSLSVTAGDINNDGFTDIYVACDYEEPDMLFLNNQKGRIIDNAADCFKHMSNFSMGADIADINNDGHLDIYAVDMVAENNYRQKINMSGMNPEKFWTLANNGYHFQYMFNALHLNNGNGTFSEVAQMAGVSKTDWSWTPLFVDFDNDQYKDLIVTNGIIKEMRNKDFEIWRKKFIAQKHKEAENLPGKRISVNPMEISIKAPVAKIANFIYQNNGAIGFTKRNKEWGFEKEGWSQGAAYADFDNDGDLDLIINNMNSQADLYQNKSNDLGINNYIVVRLEGDGKNTKGINSRITIKTSSGKQVTDLTPYRGYMSTSQPIAHFGLGPDDIIEELTVTFPSGKKVIKNNIEANQSIVINHKEATTTRKNESNQRVFNQLKTAAVRHIENEYNDYDKEILIPYKMSSLGPVVATGDVNGDGNDDIYIGGSAGQAGQLLTGNGTNFELVPNKDFLSDIDYEDGTAQFEDIDNDGDLDLYVGSGGNEFENPQAYQDRIYLNDGEGFFKKTNSLPEIKISTGTVTFFDYDSDGDKDLFVGGRQTPGRYGVPTSSYLLENKEGKYTDVTNTKAPDFINMGMVTTSQWLDVDGDKKNELLITGEWMPIMFYEEIKGALRKQENLSLKDTKGMWNTVVADDIDGDGDIDLVAGNMGLNNKYVASVDKPFKVYVNDFDNNGTHDVYLGYYDKDGNCYPVRGRSCSSDQMPFVKKKFKSYEEFATATIDKILEGKMDGSFSNECQTFAHTLFLNDGTGSFTTQILPRMSQVSPSYGIVVNDYNGDGRKDIFTAGNFYQREVETTRSDAGVGCLMYQGDNGSFVSVHPSKTGILADQDVRAVEIIKTKGKDILMLANNNGPAQFFVQN